MARNPSTIIVGLSLHTDNSVANEMRAAGARHYLTKGGPSGDLIAAIQTCLVVEPG